MSQKFLEWLNSFSKKDDKIETGFQIEIWEAISRIVTRDKANKYFD